MAAFMKRKKMLERQMAAMDSPTFSENVTTLGSPYNKGLSPITDLTNNLNCATLNTPRRKLWLSSAENTPTNKSNLSDILEMSLDSSPSTDNTLLKSAKFATPTATGQMSGKARDFRRRIGVMPSSLTFDKCFPSYDKENMGDVSSTLALDQDAISFSSPAKRRNGSPSKTVTAVHPPFRQRQPLEDQDPNSQDSGFGDKDDLKIGFRFVEPFGTAPRRQLIEQQSPQKFIEQSPQKLYSPSSSPSRQLSASFSPLLHHSLSSGSESIDDGFPEFLEIDKLDEDTQLPSGFNDLLSGTIIKNHSDVDPFGTPADVAPKLPFRRCLSMVETGGFSNIKSQPHIFKSPAPATRTSENDDSLSSLQMFRPFKRPKPPCDDADNSCQRKRLKSTSLKTFSETFPPAPKTSVLKRSLSENEATIMSALQRSSQQPDLIGDFSKPFALPLTSGRHQDLKAISCDTLAEVMSGKYNEAIGSYSIIDCRYPYEYNGGHIKGAKNMYTKDQILKELMELKVKEKDMKGVSSKRDVLIFHCEFSSERGPNLSRFLRNMDRDHNEDRYPALHYPEIYLLHGGYKDFFERYNHLCDPCSYQPMADPKHESDLRHFRAKSKSWSGDTKSNRLAIRSSLKRLGL